MIRIIIVALAFTIGELANPAGEFADVVDAANAVRAQDCTGSSSIGRPLRAEPALQDAARYLADGETLEQAVSKSGYRARESASIRLGNAADAATVRSLLARRFCRIVADPGLTEIGAFRRAADIWLVLARPFAPPDPADPAVARRVLELINEARAEARRCGRKKFPAAAPLQQADALGRAAEAHARDMANRDFLDHRGSDGRAPADRATRAGYAWTLVAENVAAGQVSPEEVVGTWLASPGHCANLMDPAYTDTGIGFAINMAGDKRSYWVQMFGARR